MLLAGKLKELGVDVILSYPGHVNETYKNSTEYLIAHLKK